MATSLQNLTLPVNPLKIIRDSQIDATPENAVGGAGSQVRMVQIDNSLNTVDVWFKLYNNAAPTVGTTAPDITIPARAGKIVTLIIQQQAGGSAGVGFGISLSMACVTNGGGTAGASSPALAVSVVVVIS
jgi:hypothetical protein